MALEANPSKRISDMNALHEALVQLPITKPSPPIWKKWRVAAFAIVFASGLLSWKGISSIQPSGTLESDSSPISYNADGRATTLIADGRSAPAKADGKTEMNRSGRGP